LNTIFWDSSRIIDTSGLFNIFIVSFENYRRYNRWYKPLFFYTKNYKLWQD